MTKTLITKKDLMSIISNAKTNMVHIGLPKHISGKEVDPGEVVGLVFVESILTHLNSRNLLTSFVEVDYTAVNVYYEPEPMPEPEPKKK